MRVGVWRDGKNWGIGRDNFGFLQQQITARRRRERRSRGEEPGGREGCCRACTLDTPMPWEGLHERVSAPSQHGSGGRQVKPSGQTGERRSKSVPNRTAANTRNSLPRQDRYRLQRDPARCRHHLLQGRQRPVHGEARQRPYRARSPLCVPQRVLGARQVERCQEKGGQGEGRVCPAQASACSAP